MAIKRNINTEIEFDESYNLKVLWDMEIVYDIPEEQHEDNPSKQLQEYRIVHRINSIKCKMEMETFSIYDILKSTGKLKNFQSLIEDKLLDSVKDKHISEF